MKPTAFDLSADGATKRVLMIVASGTSGQQIYLLRGSLEMANGS